MDEAAHYKRLWLLINALPQSAALFNREGNLLFINNSFAELSGIRPDKITYEVPLPVEAIDSKLSLFIFEALRSSTNLESEITIEKNKQTKILLAKSSHLVSDESPTILVLFDDISRIKHLEQIRQDFVSNVSHELRTPVTSIIGASEALMSGALFEPQEAKKFSEIIHRQSDRLSRIIEDLLALSKIEAESNANSIECTEQDLSAIIRAAVRNCEQRAHELGIDLSVSLKAEIRLSANRTLLEQAVCNLIENAVEHSDRGAIVSLELEACDNQAIISVIDRGCGIPAEHLGRVFERFYRVDKARSRKRGGTGLGLAIVKHVALVHHGQVEVVSEIGRGSKFSIFLPRLITQY